MNVCKIYHRYLYFNFSPNFTLFYATHYNDLDYNGHVNNAKYVEWVENLLDIKQYENRDIKTFDIKYHKEIKFGECVSMEIIDPTEIDGNIFVCGKVNTQDAEQVCFEACCEFA